MSRGIFNWNFHEVVKFLKEHNFINTHVEGSHYYFQGNKGGITRLVHVPFHGAKSFKPKTLKSMIEQSGIPKEEWLA